MEGDNMEKINKYSKKENYSFTLGAFPTYELINKASDLVEFVYIHENYYEKERLIDLLKFKNINYQISSKAINKLTKKESHLVVGVFEKFSKEIEDSSHVVLDNIADMGNLGTIIRSMNGFGINNLALVGQVCDIFNPKTIRATMGSIFDINFEHFDSMDDYIAKFGKDRRIKLFMLSRDEDDSLYKSDLSGKISLVFGNEGAGLPDFYEKYGDKVFIPQSENVDSLNLTIAVGVGLYEYRRQNIG